MKQIAGLVLGISLLSLLACSADTTSGASGSSTSTSVSASVDESAQTITTYTPTCSLENDQAVYDTEGDSNVASYVIRNDSLLIIETDEDYEDTTVFLGSSSDIFGTWTWTGDSYTATVDISENSVDVTESLSDNFCAMDEIKDYMESELEYYFDTSDTLTVKSCTEAVVTVSDLPITVRVDSYSIDGESISVSYNGSSCKLTKEYETVTPSLCTVANIDAGYIDDGDSYYYKSNYSEFYDCLDDMAGIADSALSKKLAGVFSKALKKSSLRRGLIK